MTDDNAPTADEAWARYDESPQGRETYRAAAEAVILHGVGRGPRGNEHLPPILPTIREAEERASAAAVNARAMGAGWYAPTEAERWQWLTDDERAAELAEAREAATRHGHEVIMVGGMILPHTPAPPSDGMWPLPTVSINVDTEEFRARMAEARERIGDLAAGLAAGLAAAFDAVNGGLGPALAALGRALGRALDDRDPTPPITDVETALIALDYAERTQVVHHPDKPTRRHAKARYLEVRRHLPREYRRRLKSVPVNQFGSLT